MRAAFVSGLTHVLGSRCLSLDTSAAAGRLRSRPSALRDAGFGQHRLAGPEEGADDLLRAALHGLAQRHPEAGALLLASTLSPPADPDAPRQDVTATLDLSGARLLADLGLSRAFVASLGQQACTSALGALRVARGMLASEPHLSPILVAACDRLPDGVVLEQGYSPLSDGAAACVVSTEPRGWRLVGCEAVVHGEMAGARDEEAMGRLFPVVHALATSLLARAGRSPGDVAWLVPPNIPAPAIRVLARSLGIPEERAASPTRADAGHVMACDPLINLGALDASGRARAGDLALLLATGYGLTWQATLLERMPS